MKILILSIYNDTEIYKQMKEIQISYVNKNENIEYYFVESNENLSEDVILNDNVIYVKGFENYMNILEKTIIALDYLINNMNKQYDFIIRTNISTLFNYKLLIEYLNSIPKNNIYFGGVLFKLAWIDYKYGISDFTKKLYSLNDMYYFQGTCIIMSNDVVNFILQNIIQLKFNIIDDVAIGLFIRDYLPNSYSCIYNLPRLKYSFNDFESDSVIIRNKTIDHNMDIIDNMKNFVKKIL
jgi:hypothetical protein